jgi:hypothetical protein
VSAVVPERDIVRRAGAPVDGGCLVEKRRSEAGKAHAERPRFLSKAATLSDR